MELSRVLAHNSLSGHKKEKSRITIFCATNATGSEKMTLTFIHKYKTPRVMKNINYKTFRFIIFGIKKHGCKLAFLMKFFSNSMK